MVNTTQKTDSPVELLAAAYKQLEFDQGVLLSAARQPQAETRNDWLDTGDWQSLAAQVGAEKIFFVDRDPVIVFAKTENGSPDVLKKLYERVWCMSRPQLLFLASPGQLTVFDLTKSPPRPDEQLDGHDRLIERATSIAEVQSKLGAYNRERVETGAVFDAVVVGAGFAGMYMLHRLRGLGFSARSEERRVGKECYALCRSRWSPYH